MGALHEGHLSLIRARASAVRRGRRLAVRQPGAVRRARRPGALSAPTRRDDARLAAEAGADILFAPSVEEVYPARLRHARSRCSASPTASRAPSRGAAHFRGVTTVVTKLLCMALPDVAYFGQKDAQQVRRDPPPGRRPQPAGAHRGVRRPCASPTGSRMSSRNARSRPAASATRALRAVRGARAAADLRRRGRALGRGAARRRPRRRWSRAASSRSTWRSSTPTRFEPRRRARRDRAAGASPRASARSRLIDNIVLARRRHARASQRKTTQRQATDPGEAIATCSA